MRLVEMIVARTSITEGTSRGGSREVYALLDIQYHLALALRRSFLSACSFARITFVFALLWQHAFRE